MTSVPGQVSNIYNNTTYELNIYYDPLESDNLYLKGQTYDLAGTGPGQLIPDPPVSAAAQPLAINSTNQNSSFTVSTTSASTGYFDAAAATNGYFYGLIYNLAGGSGNLRACSYSEPVPLAAYPYMDWQMYDF